MAPGPGGQPSASMQPGGAQPAACEPRALRLLDITRRIRLRERRALTDFLHDGPIQELTAATLQLQMLRGSAPLCLAPYLDAVQQLVDAAAGSMRWLVDGRWPFVRPETRLADALQQRIGWLLAEPVAVHTVELPAGRAQIDVPLIVDIVELMLLAMAPASPLTRAHVGLRAEEQPTQVQLTLTSAAEDDEMIGDQATAKASLAELACALRASVHSELGDRLWRARITINGGPSGCFPSHSG